MTWKLVLAIALCVATSARADWERWPAADRLFESTSGWIGSDAAYSVDLGGERVLWLFGDTFVGRVESGRRVVDRMVRNTLGIQTGLDPETARIELGTGTAFAPPDGRGWFWPLHGARTPHGLALFLSRIETAPNAEPFGFKQTGTALALVSNPDAAPERWHTKIVDVPFAASFGTAVAADGATLYVWGHRDRGAERACVLARAPLAAPEHFERWRFWDGARWATSPGSCAALFDHVATEMSVHRDGARWVAIYSRDGLSADVLEREAASPAGPWSEPRVIFRCPEAGPGVFTYAAKAHPELGEVATYATNADGLAKVVLDPQLYRPRFIRASGRLPGGPGRGARAR